MLIFLTGLIASVTHVVTGPDHLAAVTPLAISSRKKSWMVGFSWGVGHTLGMMMIGFLFLLLRQMLPVEAISTHSESVIGIMLIGIGGYALIRIYRRHSHGFKSHAHFHTTPFLYAHVHKHAHHNSDEHDHPHDPSGRKVLATALAIGIVHGFAGFSHLFAVLPSLAFSSKSDSVVYLVAFAFGTIAAMVAFAFILGYIAYKSVEKNKERFLKWFSVAGGLLAITVGIWWLIYPV